MNARVLMIVLASFAVGCGDSGADSAAGTGGGATTRLVFVTDTTQQADFGGLMGADALCTAQASTAGLEGEFKAWLSTIETPVVDRLARSEVPYVLVDGTVIANDWADLVDGSIQAPIDRDARGVSRGGDVWTGTLPTGAAFADGDCEGFTTNDGQLRGLCGSTRRTNTEWTAAATPDCAVALRLFCIEQ